VFVGTNVNVVRSLQTETEYGGGQVLGASTELPGTGANTLLTGIGISLLTGGSWLVIKSLRGRYHGQN
jgi:hypothetical protein